MGEVIKTISIDRAYAELEPALAEIERLVMSAPVGAERRAALAAMVAARTFGMTAAAMGLTPDDVEEIARFIGGAARRKSSS